MAGNPIARQKAFKDSATVLSEITRGDEWASLALFEKEELRGPMPESQFARMTAEFARYLVARLDALEAENKELRSAIAYLDNEIKVNACECEPE